MTNFQRMIQEAERIKEQYPPGTRIHLINMDDPYAPVPSGTRGTVDHCDGIGQLHMKWDNGRTLAVIPGVDEFRKLTNQELAEELKNASLDEKLLAASKEADNVNNRSSNYNDISKSYNEDDRNY